MRQKLIGDEFHTAKAEAASAKASGDKARQRTAGELIRDLKQEMAQMGERIVFDCFCMSCGGSVHKGLQVLS